MRFESDGHLRLYDFNGTHWELVHDLFKYDLDNCDYPTVCGSMAFAGMENAPVPYLKETISSRLIRSKQIAVAMQLLH
jgi:hypothetical protein